MLSSSGIYADITSHTITEGVSRYDQDGSGVKFDIVGSGVCSLIRDGDGDTLVAAWSGGARVVVISDESSFRGTKYNNPDNNVLIRNIFHWLADIELPVADFSAQLRTGEIPLNVEFSDKSIGNITHWRWDFGDGTGSSEQNPAHTYGNVGSYSIRLQVIGPDGADIEMKQGYINVVDVSGKVAEVEGAEFVVSDINIEPTQVLPDEVVTISVNVVNSGGTRGDYHIVLNIDGKLEDSCLISLSPGLSRSVVFNVTKAIPGAYEVSIEGYNGQFVVIGGTPNAPATNPVGNPPTSGGLGTPVIIGIILGSVGAAVAVVMVTRRRRRPDYIKDLEERYRKVLDDLDDIKKTFIDKQ
jgi:PKD repeat protein